MLSLVILFQILMFYLATNLIKGVLNEFKWIYWISNWSFVTILIQKNFSPSVVSAIDCYQCVSANETDSVGCRTPFDPYSIPYIKQCKQHIAGHSQDAL